MRYEVPCEMIRDLLPSYIDELTSDVTADIIRDHLSSCSDCRRALEDMQGEKFIPDTAGMIKDEKQNIDYLKKVKSRSKRPLWAVLALILVGLFHLEELRQRLLADPLGLVQILAEIRPGRPDRLP